MSEGNIFNLSLNFLQPEEEQPDEEQPKDGDEEGDEGKKM